MCKMNQHVKISEKKRKEWNVDITHEQKMSLKKKSKSATFFAVFHLSN